MPDLAYVNGWIGPLQEARVSILDRGFLFGDGVYEVMRTYGGRPFEFQAHLTRLENSLRGLELRPPMSRRRLSSLILDLVQRSTYADARIYVQVTRGDGPRQHVFPRSTHQTTVIYVESAPSIATSKRRRGLQAITLEDWRWKRCHLKALVLLPNVLARQQAHSLGADEAILLGPGGVVREGAASNVFVVRRNRIHTHPPGPEILPGVSRQIVLRLAQAAGLRVQEKRFRTPALLQADEVLLSSTALEIMPVVRIDGQTIGSGRPGPIWSNLHARFRALTEAAPGRPAKRSARR